MNEDKILNLLGLAQRAGKVISGDFIVEKAMKRKDPKLVLLAGDCAANNEKIPLHSIANKEALGTAIGKEVRVVVAVLDDGFAKAIVKEIDR